MPAPRERRSRGGRKPPARPAGKGKGTKAWLIAGAVAAGVVGLYLYARAQQDKQATAAASSVPSAGLPAAASIKGQAVRQPAPGKRTRKRQLWWAA